MRRTQDATLTWEERRPYWHFFYNSGYLPRLFEVMQKSLENKQRVPYDLLIESCARANIKPGRAVLASLHKGLKRGDAFTDILAAKGWDKWDQSLSTLRNEQLELKVIEQKKYKEQMVEKFHFLQSQRMLDQAGKLLRRLLELYPTDGKIQNFKSEFDEAWARSVLSNHLNSLQFEANVHDRTRTAPSGLDQEMLKCFLREGEQLAIENRGFAYDLAIAFWFLEDYARALEILAWSEPSSASDWMKAEVLFAARRFIETLEHLNQLELKGAADPETTFAVSYLRAQCLFELGQKASALEIMQSIVRVRAKYRSAHAFILDWTDGGGWD